MKTTKWVGPLMGAAMLALPVSAAAQDHGGHGERGPISRTMMAQMQAREADDIALLLNLRANQRPALAAFLGSMTPPPPPWVGEGRSAQDGPQTMPPREGFAQHLDRMTQDTARRSAEDLQRIAAARKFYDALDPTQRRAFEALLRLRHGRGPGFGPMGQDPIRMGGDGPPHPMGRMPPRP